MNMSKNNLSVLGLIFFGGLLIWIRSQIGDIAAIAFLFFGLGFVSAVIAMSLGGRLNDAGQHAFIAGLSQLKSVMTPSVKEAARTQGAADRAQIQMAAKNAPKPPSQAEIELEAFYRQYENVQ